MNEDKVKKDMEEIGTINIELEHREKDLVITALKNKLRKLKGKDLADNVVTKHPIAPEMLKVDKSQLLLRKCTPKPVVTLVYSRKPRKSKTNVPVSKPKIIKSISANNKEPSKSWGSIVSDVPSSSLDECRNDHVAKILGYGDYHIGNVTISRVYYVEGLGHNLFSVGQICYLNLEVTFRQHTCFICNLEGVDLLTGFRSNNLYTLSLGDMMASSPICLLSKASKTKMDNPNLTMEEYIRIEEEKARKRGKVFNWQTATYGKIRVDDDLHGLSSVEIEFPAIVINNAFAPQDAL
ncbi:hypothetical protein Tco_0597777 [Tanacetum coccineum]